MVKGKGGASHFEMIISFVFFVGFVFFLFLFLKPYDTTVLSGSVVAALYDTFEDQTSTNLTTVFLRAVNDDAANCFSVELPGDIFVYGLTESRVTSVADVERDSNLEVVASDGTLNIDANDTFYKVAISPEFAPGSISPCTLVSDPYTLGSITPRKVISYTALEIMEQKYNSDYDGLKSELNVPEIYEFYIESDDLPEIDMKDFVPASVNVDVNQYIFEVLKPNGELINAKFNIGVW